MTAPAAWPSGKDEVVPPGNDYAGGKPRQFKHGQIRGLLVRSLVRWRASCAIPAAA